MKLEDMITVLKHYSDNDIHDYGETLRTACPIHKSNNPTSFVINKDNTLWYCHSGGCGGGDVIKFVEVIENVTFLEAKKIVEKILGKELTQIKENDTIKEARKFIEEINNNKDCDEIVLNIDDYVRVKTYKDYGEEITSKFDLRFAKEIKGINKEGREYTLKNRLVFPIYKQGKLLFISTRRTKNDGSSKWLHLPRGTKKNKHLYNIDNITPMKPIYIVEGITDVWRLSSFDMQAVAIFGSNISDEQVNNIIKLTDTVIICLDGDEAGRIGSEKACLKLINKVNLFKIILPEGKDPDNTSEEEFQILNNKKEKII